MFEDGFTPGCLESIQRFTAYLERHGLPSLCRLTGGLALTRAPRSLTEDGSLRSLSFGSAPWRFETHEGYVANLMGEIPVSAIPAGDYTFYVAVTPPGAWTSYYLWSTTLGLP